jgi:steroid delta-isomerase-like uncharacterized protein
VSAKGEELFMNIEWAQRWTQALTAMQKGEMSRFYVQDLSFEDVALSHRVDSFESLWEWYSTAFGGDGENLFELRRWVGDERGGAIEWTWIAQHGADLSGLPLKGKSTRIEGVSVVELRDGRIAIERDFWSLATLLQQVGALPELQGA